MITATVFKETKNVTTGLQFMETNSKLVAYSIIDGGLFSSTDLRVGMEILSINDESMEGKSVMYASTKVVSLQGEVRIKAQQPTTSIPTAVPSSVTAVTATITNDDAERNQATLQPVVTAALISGSDDFVDSPNVESFEQLAQPLVNSAEVLPSANVVLQAPSEIQTAELVGELPAPQQIQGLLRQVLEPPQEHPPPPGVPDGGVWGSSTYYGPKTICLGVMGCALAFVGGIGCIPRSGCDVMRAYALNNMVYDENGNRHGIVGNVRFQPNERYRKYAARMTWLRANGGRMEVRGRTPPRTSPMNRNGATPIPVAIPSNGLFT